MPLSAGSTKTIARLQVILSGNTEQLQNAFKKAESASAQAMRSIQSDSAKVQAATSRLNASTSQALNKLQSSTSRASTAVTSSTSTIGATLGRVAGLVASAFAVGSIVNFGKSCIELGSDLTEVQNVVDVTFGSLSGQVDSFAKSAITQFGLSETAAKKYASTMGAVLKSMGLSTDTAYEMSAAMTGLAGDMASFYNLKTDDAFEKIRSGITGETEPLKQLGINMSVANLEAFALAKGITKSYESMSQAEQAILRYNYLLNATADAQGDFARTSDSWANQMRVFAMEIESFKASVGQGLIMLLTPVLNVLNSLLGRLVTAGETFRVFAAAITGSDLSDATTNIGSFSSVLDDSASAAANTGKSYADAMKEATNSTKRFLLGFDEINRVSKPVEFTFDDDALDAISSGYAGMDLLADAMGNASGSASDMSKSLEDMKRKLAPLTDAIKRFTEKAGEGYKEGLGDTIETRTEDINDSIDSIKRHMLDIFTDPQVRSSAQRFTDSFAYSFGQVLGSVESIRTTLKQNWMGGIDSFLDENEDSIKKRLASVFDISGEIQSMFGDLASSTATILEPIGSESGQELTGNIIGIQYHSFTGAVELAMKAYKDAQKVFTEPIVNNESGLQNVTQDLMDLGAGLTEPFEEAAGYIDERLNGLYDESISPIFDKIADGASGTVDKVIQKWDEAMDPFIGEISEELNDVWENDVKPLFDDLIDDMGDFGDVSAEVWDLIQPAIDWIAEVVAGGFFENIKGGIRGVVDQIRFVAEQLRNVYEISKKISEFVANATDWFGDSLLNGDMWTYSGGLAGWYGYNAGRSSQSTTSSARTASTHNAQGSAGNTTQKLQDDMYSATLKALNDANKGDVNLYIDGEQLATAVGKASSIRNTRVNPVTVR